MKDREKGSVKNRIPLVAFVVSVALLIFLYGFAVERWRLFPHSILDGGLALIKAGYAELKLQSLRWEDVEEVDSKALPWYYDRPRAPFEALIHDQEKAYPGLNLVTGVGPDLELFAKIIDMDGNLIQTWNVDWFDVWPDADHLPEDLLPKSRPGTVIHGASVARNGDLIFNFDGLGLVRMGSDGEVIWRLPYRAHHSVTIQDDGIIWVPGVRRHTEPDPAYPHRLPPFHEFTIAQVSPEGEVIAEETVNEILRLNGKLGIIYTGEPLNNVITDQLHQNDVEPFPASMEEGYFTRGDVAVSLRATSTVFVYNQVTRKIKLWSVGDFVHQHDPDFVDGNTLSVLDNCSAVEGGSRIAKISMPDFQITDCPIDTSQAMFFTSRLGKHQWLPNGNLLVTESEQGRAFEVTDTGEIVWQYVNYVGEGIVGVVTEVQRIPEDYRSFYRRDS